MYERKVLPFYMSYPLPMYYKQEDTAKRDLEYLQQIYPREAKKYQKMITSILDKMDYEGSMIYDEYPDRWQLYKQAREVLDRIKSELEKEDSQMNVSPEQWEWLADLVQILVYYDIYRRRHHNKSHILDF